MLYIANARIPTEKAHGLQIIKMCAAFARKLDVELVVPFRLQAKLISPGVPQFLSMFPLDPLAEMMKGLRMSKSAIRMLCLT